MDRRITIQSYACERDGFGGAIPIWTNVATIWAEVTQESGREFLNADTIRSERKVIFRLRWRGGITVTHRVLYEGREHNIHEVRELGRREGLELHATATG